VSELAVIVDPASASYDFGPEHPFSPQRVEMVRDLVRELGLAAPEITPEPASRDDMCTVHASEYVDRVAELSRPGADRGDAERWGLGTADNPIFEGMDLATRRVVGGTLTAARLVADGTVKRALHLGGGLHHAARARASGFCVYSDLGVAIEALRRRGLRVAYLDIDVHHGDGVQQLFYGVPEVCTLSIHEAGRYLFPGTGEIHELGEGAACGTKLNLPLMPFTEDASYLEVFERVVPEALATAEPDVLVVQAGADAHYDDPLADLKLTTRAYEQMFRRILELADRFTKGRVVVTLGGGYSMAATPRVWTILYLTMLGVPLPVRLPEAWRARWEKVLEEPLPEMLHDPESPFPEIPRRAEIERHNRVTSERLLRSLREITTGAPW
jgi:acetoin utilization protein AcuC